MKKAALVSTIITTLVASATTYCGLTIRAHNATDPQYLNFHMSIGIATVVCCIITAVLVIITLNLATKKSKKQHNSDVAN